MVNFAARCQARVPERLHEAFGKATDDAAAWALSVEVAADQWRELIAEGVEHLHVYTLNNPDLSFEICRALGYEAEPLAVAGGAA